jgi:hypothetical protein
MDRPLRVLSKVTDTPYTRNWGAMRRSSLPSIEHVFGQPVDAAFFLPTICVKAACRAAAVPVNRFATRPINCTSARATSESSSVEMVASRLFWLEAASIASAGHPGLRP